MGNLPEVVASTYASSYDPILTLLERHPAIRFVAHYSGPLLDWLATESPGFLHRLRRAVQTGQAEMLGGALEEPILAVIPDADKEGQVHAMSDRLEAVLGVRPRGAWLAERVWEPHLPPFLRRCGIRYTVLDEEHFEKAGLRTSELDGYFATEDGGQVLGVFPASTELRYLIPWRDVREVVSYLRQKWERGRRLIVFADDGEKFGGWPGTHRHCYEDGWLERFLQALEESALWLHTDTLSNCLATDGPSGRVYLPSASYHEMEDWSLPPHMRRALVQAREAARGAGLPRAAAFMRLGHWRSFLARYAEANVAQQRSTAISAMVHALPSGRRRSEALAHLWRGQCNCPYWHGVFGGIYMYHVRHATFAELIAAESLAEGLGAGQAIAISGDFDADGESELRLATPEQVLYIHGRGGCLYEWALRPLPLNLLNTLASYPEAYSLPHDQAAPAPVALRRAFMDRLLTAMPSLEDVIQERWPLCGDWTTAPYRLEASAEGAMARAMAAHSGWMGGGEAELRLQKTYTVAAGARRVRVGYCLQASAKPETPPVLAVELNLAMPPGSHQFGRAHCAGVGHELLETWCSDDTRAVVLSTTVNRELSVVVEWDGEARLIGVPLLSHHRGEQGDEQVYQGSRLVLAWPLGLADGGEWATELQISWDG